MPQSVGGHATVNWDGGYTTKSTRDTLIKPIRFKEIFGDSKGFGTMTSAGHKALVLDPSKMNVKDALFFYIGQVLGKLNVKKVNYTEGNKIQTFYVSVPSLVKAGGIDNFGDVRYSKKDESEKDDIKATREQIKHAIKNQGGRVPDSANLHSKLQGPDNEEVKVTVTDIKEAF